MVSVEFLPDACRNLDALFAFTDLPAHGSPVKMQDVEECMRPASEEEICGFRVKPK